MLLPDGTVKYIHTINLGPILLGAILCLSVSVDPLCVPPCAISKRPEPPSGTHAAVGSPDR
jgi:hypothetical protein